jgi:hypothetical protein
MAINYPSSLDTLVNPVGTDQVATVDHALQHQNANAILTALEVKVGANSSAVTTSHDYKLSNVTGSDKAAPGTNATLVTPTIASFVNATHTHQNAAGGGTLDAAAIASGTIATARLGSGSATSATFLRGDQTYATPTAVQYPESFYTLAAGLDGMFRAMSILNQYVDSTTGFSYCKAQTTTLNLMDPAITGSLQSRATTSDWASATAINSTVRIGSFLYVLLLNGTTSYQVWRYTANNLAAGGTICTFVTQAIAYNNTAQIMTSDGTNIFFNYKNGNSANDYVLSKYTVSGTVLTYVSDITCGAAANVLDRVLYIDGSTNIYGQKASDGVIRKYNSSGTLQTSSPAIKGRTQTAVAVLNMGSNVYSQDAYQDGLAANMYVMSKLYY